MHSCSALPQPCPVASLPCAMHVQCAICRSVLLLLAQDIAMSLLRGKQLRIQFNSATALTISQLPTATFPADVTLNIKDLGLQGETHAECFDGLLHHDASCASCIMIPKHLQHASECSCRANFSAWQVDMRFDACRHVVVAVCHMQVTSRSSAVWQGCTKRAHTCTRVTSKCLAPTPWLHIWAGASSGWP